MSTKKSTVRARRPRAARRTRPPAPGREPDLFFNLSEDLLCIAGFDEYFKYLNPAWERTLGFSLPELLARPYLDFVHPDDRAATQIEAGRLAGGETVLVFENRFVCRDGSYKWLSWSANSRPAEQLVYAVARDITERRRVDLALRHSAARLEMLREIDRAILAAHSPQAIASAALAGLRRLTPASRASAVLFDFQSGEASVLAVEADEPSRLAAGQRLPLAAFESLPGLRRDLVQRVDDIARLPERSTIDAQLLAEGVRARLSLALQTEGQLIGALNLGAAEPGAFSAEQVEIVRAVADQLAIAVRQAQLRDATRQRLTELAGLHEIASSLGVLGDVRHTYGILVERIALLIAARRCVIVLRDPDDFWRAQAPGYGLSDAEVANLCWPVEPDIRRLELYDSLPQILAVDELPPGLQILARAMGVEAVLFAPMWIERRVIGHVLVAGKPGGFGEAELRLLGVFASQAAVIIQNARLFEQTQQQALQTTALLASAEAISTSLAFETALSIIADQAKTLLAADGSRIHLLEPDGVSLRCVIARQAQPEALLALRLRLGQGLVGRVALSGEPLLANTVDPAAVHVPGTTRENECLALAPLRWAGRALGVITVSRAGLERPFTAGDLRLLMGFGVHAAIAIERARLYESERAAREQAEVLRAASAALSETLDLDLILERLLDYLGRLVPYASANVLLVEGGGRAVVRASCGYENRIAPPVNRPAEFMLEDFPTLATIVATRQSLVVDDARADERWVPLPPSAHIRAWLGVPLVSGERVIGIYSLDQTTPGFYTAEHVRLAEALAAQAVVAVQNARLFEQVRQGREQLQALSRRLVEVQESERRQLARELHDEIGQALTGLKLLLGLLPRLPPEAWPARLSEAVALVSSLMERVHDLSLDLRPAMLDDLGLSAALLWLFERFGGQTGVRIQPEFTRLDRRLPAEVETTTYRIVQEALTNVARHAGVALAHVRLLAEPDRLRLQIQDDGRGFDVAGALASGQRAGLAGMRERAALLGGSLHITSAPGAGTLVSAVLPLRAPVEQAAPGERSRDGGLDPAGG